MTGRRLRKLDDDHPGLRRHVDAAVLENGAVLLGPRGSRLLAPPVPRELTDALTRHGVPHHTGEVLVDCDARDAHRALDALADTGLDHQMVRNRGTLMVLPAGVTKATGLKQALAELGLCGQNAVAVGDAENDLRLLHAVELSVAGGGGPHTGRSPTSGRSNSASTAVPGSDLPGAAQPASWRPSWPGEPVSVATTTRIRRGTRPSPGGQFSGAVDNNVARGSGLLEE